MSRPQPEQTNNSVIARLNRAGYGREGGADGAEKRGSCARLRFISRSLAELVLSDELHEASSIFPWGVIGV
jgi:hypothetical protein